MFAIEKVSSRSKFNSLKKTCVYINSCFMSLSPVSLTCSSKEALSYAGVRKTQYDIAVVGAGIIGLGTALELKKRFPSYSMCVIDKEPYVAFHQSGRNSGVIHAGIYYKPGSLRAKLCVEGMHMMYDFCEKQNIKYKRNGKLIIAVNQQETVWLKDLYKTGTANNVPDLKLLDVDEFREIEPYMTGLQALYSPYTGIVEFADVAREFARIFRNLGGNIILNFKVAGFCENTEGDGSTEGSTSAYPMTIISEDHRTVKAGFVITCGGLHADTLAKMSGESPYPKIMPFRGVYYLLNPEKNCMVNGNVYPVPDPSMPFIGVHFTPKVDGSVWLGPTAMLAYKKEGYSSTDIDFGDIADMLKFEGLYRFFFKHPASCIYEVKRSFSAPTLLRELQQFMPTLRLKDMTAGASVGVQAQAMNKDGSFSEDFGFSSSKSRILHCRNAPSPAATSSLAIAKHVASEVEKRL